MSVVGGMTPFAQGGVDLDSLQHDTNALIDDASVKDFVRAFSIGVAGIVKITTHGGSEITYASGELAAGIVHPIGVKIFWTDTTATGVKGYW